MSRRLERIYFISVAVIFFASVSVTISPVHHWSLVVLVSASMTMVELSSAMFSTSMLSLTSAVIVMSSISFGPFQTSLSLLLSMLYLLIHYRRGYPLVVVFNMSQYGLSGLIGLWAYTSTGGIVGTHDAHFMALMSFAVAYSITNLGIAILGLFLHSRSTWHEFFQGSGFYLTAYVVEMALGGFGTMLYGAYGVRGLVVLSVVLWVVLLVYKRSVDMTQAAETDDLTGLLNRKAFQQRLGPIMKREHCASLLVIDLDHFKEVNDASGHQNGDKVLQDTAQIIRQTVGPTGIISRYGGEEFCVLLFTGDGAIFAEKLLKTIDQHQFDVAGKPLHLTVSVGVAMYPKDAADWEGLFECADRALYEAKRVRNIVVEYSPQLCTELCNSWQERHMVENRV